MPYYDQTNERKFQYGEYRNNPTRFEKIMNKSFFIGEAGLYNIQLPTREMISIDTADKIADEIMKIPLRVELGDNISELEKFALRVLKDSY